MLLPGIVIMDFSVKRIFLIALTVIILFPALLIKKELNIFRNDFKRKKLFQQQFCRQRDISTLNLNRFNKIANTGHSSKGMTAPIQCQRDGILREHIL